MILDRKIQMNDGSMRATFWIDGWKKKEDILKEVKNEIHLSVILSSSLKYIYGLTGRETQITIFAVNMSIVEVNGKKDEDGEEAYYA
jgi:hypothetical protein